MSADDELLRRNRRLIAAEIELFGASSASARVLRLPGVVAAVSSKAPDRSVFNWCLPESSDALLAAYAELRRVYAQAGVRAWAVWLDGGDEGTARALVERGHLPDGRPVAMGAEIRALTLPEPGDLVWQEVSDISSLSAINDAAYGVPPPAFGAALTHLPDPRFRAYIARDGARPVSSVMTWESPDGDCGVTAVATLPDFARRGLASRLLAVAVRAAERRGATTTTLQASTKGAPVYARLGYRNLGELSLWEHRVPAPK